ncbi:MAG: hypothetical protein M9887_06615 [Chitinophagales bacterium]|nr:hypothetical protein [Chitinophagales bacterium]
MKINNWLLLFAISAIICFLYFYVTPGYLHPSEDATIIFNYSQNLKETGVISYYPGGPRVDGTTDFLFMLLVSLVMDFVGDAYIASLWVSAISTMLMLFFILRLIGTKYFSLQIVSVLLILFSQQIWAAVLGYGTFLYAMVICWAVLAYWKGGIKQLGFISFIAILCRPDAIITVVPLLLHKIYAHNKLSVSKRLLSVFLFFVLPSLLYGLFRLNYFGRLLPLSYDINVAGEGKILGLIPIGSFHHVKSYALYFIYPGLIGLLIYILKSKFKINQGYYVLIFSMIVLPMLSYLFVREDLDSARRYFVIPYLGVIITMCLLIRNHKSIIVSVFGVILLIVTIRLSVLEGIKTLNDYYNNMYHLSEELSQFENKKLATTEAGTLTWKSRWASIDLWGLNSAEYTHHLVTMEDLNHWQPDMMVLHSSSMDYTVGEDNEAIDEKSWDNMIKRAVHFAKDNHYITFLVPYDIRAYQDAKIENIGLTRSLLKFISEKNTPSSKVYRRQDLFGIRPDTPNKPELIKLVEKYGGKSYIIP